MTTYRVLKIRKRRAEAYAEVAGYRATLSEADREWLDVFLDAEYGADSYAQAALAPSLAEARVNQSRVNQANYADRMDLYSRMRRTDADILRLKDEGLAPNLPPTPNVFPVKERQSKYSPADYAPSEPSDSIEDMLIDAIDARNAEERSLVPYGFNPRKLKPGHYVQVCMPAHFLKDRVGKVVAYRPWTNDYLVEVFRRTKKDRDGSSQPTTLCWVSPFALRRAEPKAVESK